jgi:hypothetical protein
MQPINSEQIDRVVDSFTLQFSSKRSVSKDEQRNTSDLSSLWQRGLEHLKKSRELKKQIVFFTAAIHQRAAILVLRYEIKMHKSIEQMSMSGKER